MVGGYDDCGGLINHLNI